MKRSLLSILIGAVFLVSGCNSGTTSPDTNSVSSSATLQTLASATSLIDIITLQGENVFGAKFSQIPATIDNNPTVTLTQGQFFVLKPTLLGSSANNQSVTLTNQAQLEKKGFKFIYSPSKCVVNDQSKYSRYCKINVIAGLAANGTYKLQLVAKSSVAGKTSVPLSATSVTITIADKTPLKSVFTTELVPGSSSDTMQASGLALDSNGTTAYINGSSRIAGIYNYYLSAINSKTGKVKWVVKENGGGHFTQSDAVTSDSSGNAYIAGYTDGSLAKQPKQGYNDYFVAKYAGNGKLIWSRQAGFNDLLPGKPTAAFAHAVATDSTGAVYVGGELRTFPDKIPGQAYQQYFLAKYSKSGQLLWTLHDNLGMNTGGIAGIAVDSSDRIYVTGQTLVSVFNQAKNGNSDYFVAQFDSAGNLGWARQIGAGSGTTSMANSIALDSQNNLYIGGSTWNDLTGGSSRGQSYFVAKFDEQGNKLWTRQPDLTPCSGAGCSAIGGAITIDKQDNVYSIGRAKSADLSFNGQAQNADQGDYYIAKYDSAGNLLLARQFGDNAKKVYAVYDYGIAVDAAGNIYTSSSINQYLNNIKGEWYSFLTKFTQSN